VNALHITGVGQHGAYAQLMLDQWRDLLHPDREPKQGLRAFAWSIITASHTRAFLRKNAKSVPLWVDWLVANNTFEGVGQVLRQSHDDAACLAEAVASLPCPVMFVTGAEDELVASRVAAEHSVVVERAGHAVPLEQPVAWRDSLLAFLDASTVT
jgi:pimeloyl-ACP methyl ester carboxylesterase